MIDFRTPLEQTKVLSEIDEGLDNKRKSGGNKLNSHSKNRSTKYEV